MSSKIANPAPLGLMGFGFTTVLLNLLNSGLLGADALGVILPMGIFFGGLAQILAGLLEEKHGNTFGTFAFTFPKAHLAAEIINEAYRKTVLPIGKIAA